MASLAAGKSRRQINDWLMRRSRRSRVRKFDTNLSGQGGNTSHAIALRQLYVWLRYIPDGDMILFYCESAEAERQMNLWEKWINRHHPWLIYTIDRETKCFYFYKPRRIE